MTVDFAFNLDEVVSIVDTPATGTVVSLQVDHGRNRLVRVWIVTTGGEDTWPWYREDQLKAVEGPAATEAKPTGVNHGK